MHAFSEGFQEQSAAMAIKEGGDATGVVTRAQTKLQYTLGVVRISPLVYHMD